MEMDSLDDDLLNAFATQWEPTALESGSQNVVKSQATDKSDVPDSKSLEVLMTKFGHRQFRPYQWQIISSILKHKRDNCAIMTTGYGKSLCYQFPAVFSGGVTLVISPLISLMEDQVLSLTIANIPACLLGTAQKNTAQTIADILKNKFSLVYLTPEFCTGEFGISLLKDMNSSLQITLIAVDEAHCVSSWGHDFRHSYRQLGMLKTLLPEVPVLAVTATATERVKNDIIKSLKLLNPQLVGTGFDRPNLYYAARPKGSSLFDDLKPLMTRKNGKWGFDGSTIIYCITRKDTANLSEVLQNHQVSCLPYHAGLSLAVRKETHEQFVKDKIPVIIATIAFGMGIDKPDIRNVIHYGSSGSIESYYQEVGRAGRDGLPSKCVAFFSSQDFATHGFLIEKGQNSNRRAELLSTMKQYLNSRKCRRAFLVSYFEGKADLSMPERSDCCDNCLAKTAPSDQSIYEGVDERDFYDFTEDAVKYLSAISALGGKYGHGMYIMFVRGSKSSKIPDRLRSHPSFGTGKNKSDDWWKAIANFLDLKHYLKQAKSKTASSFSFSVFDVSDEGLKFLNTPPDSRKLLEQPTLGILHLLKKRQTTSGWISSGKAPSVSGTVDVVDFAKTEETHQEVDERLQLLRLLKNARSQLARSNDCMPYMVASDFILMEMARHKPRHLDQLRGMKIEGLTEARIEKFGHQLLEVIKNNTADVCKSSNRTLLDILKVHPIPGAKVVSSSSISYEYFTSCKSVDQVAAKRNLALSTVFGHLVSLLKCGYPIKLEDLGVSSATKQTILEAIRKLGGVVAELTPIKAQCPDDVTYDQIKCVCAYLHVRKHLKDLGVQFEDFDEPLEELPLEESCDSEAGFDDHEDSLLSALVDQMEQQITEDKKQSLPNLREINQSASKAPEEAPPLKKSKLDDEPRVETLGPTNEVSMASEVKSSQSGKKKLPAWLMNKRV
ncbi:Werner syndrome ATP-dependent helicase [Dendroctonus ponderosae]